MNSAEEISCLRAFRTIGPYDCLIAAQARRRAAALATLNVREFARVPGLIVMDWGM
jgi:tRNA(fMet)-specific endonuclease VapC